MDQLIIYAAAIVLGIQAIDSGLEDLITAEQINPTACILFGVGWLAGFAGLAGLVRL